jgi:hypothetical protein
MRSLISKFLLVLILCSLVSLLVWREFDYSLTGIDDANIYFVYARNLANGQGFVYNVGGEHVSGFTSLLWTLISALVFRVSTHPELVLLIINVIFLSLGLAVALVFIQNDFLGEGKSKTRQFLYSAIFLILVLSSPRYMVWNTITLMENSLWSTLLLVTTIFVVKQHHTWRTINSGFVPPLVLLVLTRPESVLWGTVFVCILFTRLAFAQTSRVAIKTLVPSILSLIGSVTFMGLFWSQYFGYILPNTYYAKVSPSFVYNLQQGIGYLSRYIISDPVVLLSVIAIAIAGVDTFTKILKRKIPEDGSLFLPIAAGTGLLAPLITGGDHFGSFRLYQNIYPIEVLCLLYFIDRILPRFLKSAGQPTAFRKWNMPAVRISLGIVLAIVFCLSQFQMWQTIRSEIQIEFTEADYGRKNGAYIERLFSTMPKLPSLGVVTSGGIKYSYPGEVVDLMGLNNTIMAHNHGDRRGIKNHAAFDIPTFYLLEPDIVWPVTVVEENWQYHEADIKNSWENSEGLKGLFDQPRFLEMYDYASVSDKTEKGYALVAWFKKDLLKKLNAYTDFRVEVYPYTP